MKRYAIVRVDGNHKPSHFEVERIENIADLKLLDNIVETYGDTKEQLVLKVAQVLERETGSNAIISIPYERTILLKEIAEEIVEFLGVEE